MTETMRSFNDAVENADVLTDFQFDTESVEVLTDRLAQTKAFPLSVEWLKNAIAGISIKR